MARVSQKATALAATGAAHLIQDGLVALQFVLLPVLAQAFGLNYAQVGLIKAVSNGALSAMEIPSGIIAERTGERRLLAMGLVCAGIGYISVALSTSYIALLACFLIAGIGAGFQHSLSSSIIVRVYDSGGRRQALGTYNALGDAGKLTFAGVFSAALGVGLNWTTTVTALGVFAILSGAVIFVALRGLVISPGSDAGSLAETSKTTYAADGIPSRWGILEPGRFSRLGVIVFLDSTIQTVFLTFLAFVLIEKGAGASMTGIAVVLALAGGMVGKFICGFFAARFGDRDTFLGLQLLTIAGIGALLLLPLMVVLVLLPLIGLVVQGSSTITYGSVSDYISADKQARGYSLIYTLANVSSVTGPFIIGIVADQVGLMQSMWALTALAAITILLGGFTISSRKGWTGNWENMA